MTSSSDYDLRRLKRYLLKNKDFNLYLMPRLKHHYVKNEYEPITSKIVQNYLHGGIFVDVGAHLGYYSVLAAKSGAKKIISLEPSKKTFKALQKNIKLHEIKNIKLINKAASVKSGSKFFKITSASDSSGFYGHPKHGLVKKTKVKTVRLDNLLGSQKIELAKIDVEGAELEVLRGFKKTISKNKRIKLIVEYNPECLRHAGYQPKKLLDLIDGLGFEQYVINDHQGKMYKILKKDFNKLEQRLDREVNIFCVPKKRSLSVTYFSHDAGLGGSLQAMAETIEALQKKDVIFNIVFPFEGSLKKRLQKRGVNTTICNYKWWCSEENLAYDQAHKQTQDSWQSLARSLKKIKKWNSDVIVTNTITIPWGAVFSQYIRKPHVWYLHEFGDIDQGQEYFLGFKESQKYIFRYSDVVIANSKAVSNHFKKNIKSKLKTIYYAMNLPRYKSDLKAEFEYKYKNSLKLVIFSAIKPKKGQIDAVRAVAELIKSGENVELLVFGNQPYPKYIKKLKKIIEKNNAKDRIHIKGFNLNPLTIVSQADLVLMCSDNEAFGRVTAEAMMLEKPVIGTNTGATPEIIQDGKTGFLYTRGDYKMLTEKIAYFIKHPKKIKIMGKKGKQFIENNFTEKNYLNDFYKTLKQLKGKYEKRS